MTDASVYIDEVRLTEAENNPRSHSTGLLRLLLPIDVIAFSSTLPL